MHLSSFCTLAIGGVLAATAAMAAATQVNIADPNATSRVAKVEVGNRLAVQEVSPATFFHTSDLAITSGSGCVAIATPPSSKALVIRQVRVDVYNNPSPGSGQFVSLYLGSGCSDFIGDINPPGVGLFTVTFDPGLAIPNGSALSANAGGSIEAETFVDGYKVDTSVAPAAGGQTIKVSGKSRQ